ncbi:hypothetical protein PGT21_004977 [Puccinia graminis f. sp. tritici]|uniref:Uncharacterized protein n=2 Tax=Puccinia graminis f. sp. tritici TaxID=56615 RepID=A0A5B0P3J1_PUCGR|nr:hypothetical protein PGT21_004977 [Puccinia graminis f. sp. tritici]KAA1118355.1 hypothetical protein PGTUg99_005383 [Puccinia graminis f. sp. tritici]
MHAMEILSCLLLSSLLGINIQTVTATNLGNLDGHLWEERPVSIENYQTDDLFAALSPLHATGFTPLDEVVHEEQHPQWSDSSTWPTSPLIYFDFPEHPTNHEVPHREQLAPPTNPSSHPYSLYHPGGRTSRLSDQGIASSSGQTRQVLSLEQHDRVDQLYTKLPRQKRRKLRDPNYRQTQVETQMKGLREFSDLVHRYQSSDSHQNYFTLSGELLMPQLKRHKKKFKVRLEAAGNLHTERKLSRRPHPGLPLVRIDFGEKVQALRILKGSSATLQTDRTMNIHYKNLIVFMHKFYGEALDLWGVPRTAQVAHQERMLNWLHKECFDPPPIGPDKRASLPIKAELNPPFPVWREDLSDGSIAENQVKLILYFSQVEGDLGLLPSTAFELLEQFKKKLYEKLEPAAKSVTPEDPIEPLTSENGMTNLIQEGLKYLPKLVSDQDLAGLRRDIDHVEGYPNPKMIRDLLRKFLDQADRTLTSRMKVKEVHPTLPIALYESEQLQRDQRAQPIRIFRKKESSAFPLDSIELLPRVRRLMVVLDLFHIRLLERLQKLHIPVHHPQARRKDLLEWLLQNIITPGEGILPIHGLLLTPEAHSPWNGLTKKAARNLFGTVQRELIDQFSVKGHKRFRTLRNKTTFLTLTWYQIYHPNDLHSLIERFDVHSLV